jgi:hypothetical protein
MHQGKIAINQSDLLETLKREKWQWGMRRLCGGVVLCVNWRWWKREERHPDHVPLQCLFFRGSLGNYSKVRCLTPKGMGSKLRALPSFVSTEKIQLANPVCLCPLSPVLYQPLGSLRFTGLSQLSIVDPHLSVWHLP